MNKEAIIKIMVPEAVGGVEQEFIVMAGVAEKAGYAGLAGPLEDYVLSGDAELGPGQTFN